MLQTTVKFNWVLEPGRFLSEDETRTLLRTARRRAVLAATRRHKVPVRDYFIVDLALSTGLRVMEIAQLKCGDIFIRDGISSLLVRNGKGGRRRLVHFGESFKQHFKEFMPWKKALGESVGPHDPVLRSSVSGSQMSRRAIQKAFKRTAAKAGLSPHYSIHWLRHTYACQLYKVSGYNLRLVQKQLGHASIRTTKVYADVMEPDIQDALKRLYKCAQRRESVLLIR